MGGLHDYINDLENDKIIKYILNEVDEHEELTAEKLNELSGVTEIKTTMGGLHDYIFKIPIETLRVWALSCEMYHNKSTGAIVIGGLHDYLYSMSTKDLIDYILKMAKEHPELNSKVKLDALSIEYGFVQPEKKLPAIGGGIHDYLVNQKIEKLRDWALTCEKYHRKVNNLILMGGLHDYIETLTSADLMDYINREVAEHPELNNVEKMDQLANEYGFGEKVTVGKGGLHDYIWRESIDTLKTWALTCEKQHRIANNITKFRGGLHDYIDTLSKEQLIEYILKEAAEHEEINSRAKLNAKAEEYKILKPTN